MKASDRYVKIVSLLLADGKPLPPPTSGKDWSNRLQDVA